MALELVECGKMYVPKGGPCSLDTVLKLNTDTPSDAWELKYPPEVWHRLAIPDIPENTVAISLNAVLAISLGYYLGIADLMVFFRAVGGREPDYWTWQACGMQHRVMGTDGKPYNAMDCPRSNAGTIVHVINRQVEFKYRKVLNYHNAPASPNWPDVPSMGAGSWWDALWVAPEVL